MAQEKSAIYQMFMGKRGNYECMHTSEEYRNALSKFVDKYEELEKQLHKYPKLLALFNEMMEASDEENSIFANDVYIEAFSFGLAIGQEVFSK